jgi:hypothetical protein
MESINEQGLLISESQASLRDREITFQALGWRLALWWVATRPGNCAEDEA